MNNNLSVLLTILLLLHLPKTIVAFDAEKTEVTTADILSMPISDPTCHNYCFEGICVWLICSIYECEIETSIRVSHYNPDLIVSVYDESGENPWTEGESLYSDLEKSAADSLVGQFHTVDAGGGHRTEGGNPATDQSLRFKEAAAIGHPMSSFADYFLSDTGYFCPSEAESFFPYFSSSVDALTWRLGLPEMLYLYNLLPGVRVVGEGGFFQQWGPMWPRTGFINQKDDAKAAAVIAQRAGNIVTQTFQPHIYWPLNGNNYNRTWLPGELVENDASTGVWQMIAPKQDEQCYAFGENDVFSTAWSEDRQTEDNRYVFSLWRPYSCCEAKGAYLFTVPARICL
jgi:integrating conjugative element protein (TIGR03756 family)